MLACHLEVEVGEGAPGAPVNQKDGRRRLACGFLPDGDLESVDRDAMPSRCRGVGGGGAGERGCQQQYGGERAPRDHGFRISESLVTAAWYTGAASRKSETVVLRSRASPSA